MVKYKEYAGGGDYFQKQTPIVEVKPNITIPPSDHNYGFEITMAIIAGIIAPIIVAKVTKKK